jgi:hypothetical protein
LRKRVTHPREIREFKARGRRTDGQTTSRNAGDGWRGTGADLPFYRLQAQQHATVLADEMIGQPTDQTRQHEPWEDGSEEQ